MKLTISREFQEFAQKIGLSFEQFLAEANIPNYLLKIVGNCFVKALFIYFKYIKQCF